jgi:hypothetical protein
MPALSPVKKERVGLRGSRMGTKENKIVNRGKTMFMGVLRKKLKHTVIQKYFFLEILINVKEGPHGTYSCELFLLSLYGVQ